MKQAGLLVRIALIILLLTSLTACSVKKPEQSGIIVPQELNADEARMIAIARQFVATNQNWPDAEFERPKRNAQAGWSVLVWKLPKTPDLDMLISIDDAGHVTKSHIGL